MASTGFKLDTSQFRRALEQYKAVSKRDIAEIINRKTRDVVLRTVRSLPKAAKATISDLPQKDWWPKYIAKTISKKGVRITINRRSKRKGKSRPRTFVYKGRYTRGQARQVSRTIVANRRRGVGFLRAAVLKAGQPFGVTAGASGAITKATGSGSRASALFLRSKLMMEYESARGAKSAGRARYIVGKALQSAVEEVRQDMLTYINRKLAERAREFSAK